MYESLDNRVKRAESAVYTLEVNDPSEQLLSLKHDIGDLKDKLTGYDLMHRGVQEQVKDITSAQENMNDELIEQKAKISNYYHELETRLTNELNAHRNTMTDELNNNEWKIMERMNALQNQLEQCQLSTLSTTQKHYTLIEEEMKAGQDRLTETMEQWKEKLDQEYEQQLQHLQEAIQDHQQSVFYSSAEEEVWNVNEGDLFLPMSDGELQETDEIPPNLANSGGASAMSQIFPSAAINDAQQQQASSSSPKLMSPRQAPVGSLSASSRRPSSASLAASARPPEPLDGITTALQGLLETHQRDMQMLTSRLDALSSSQQQQQQQGGLYSYPTSYPSFHQQQPGPSNYTSATSISSLPVKNKHRASLLASSGVSPLPSPASSTGRVSFFGDDKISAVASPSAPSSASKLRRRASTGDMKDMTTTITMKKRPSALMLPSPVKEEGGTLSRTSSKASLKSESSVKSQTSVKSKGSVKGDADSKTKSKSKKDVTRATSELNGISDDDDEEDMEVMSKISKASSTVKPLSRTNSASSATSMKRRASTSSVVEDINREREAAEERQRQAQRDVLSEFLNVYQHDRHAIMSRLDEISMGGGGKGGSSSVHSGDSRSRASKSSITKVKKKPAGINRRASTGALPVHHQSSSAYTQNANNISAMTSSFIGKSMPSSVSSKPAVLKRRASMTTPASAASSGAALSSKTVIPHYALNKAASFSYFGTLSPATQQLGMTTGSHEELPWSLAVDGKKQWKPNKTFVNNPPAERVEKKEPITAMGRRRLSSQATQTAADQLESLKGSSKRSKSVTTSNTTTTANSPVG